MKESTGSRIIDFLSATFTWFDISNPFVRLALAVSLIITFLLVWHLARYLLNRFIKYVISDKSGLRKPLNIQRQEILSAEDVSKVLGSVVKVTGWLAIAFISLGFLSALMGLFEWSRKFSRAFASKTMESVRFISQQLVDYIPDLIIVVLILLLVRFLIHVLRLVFEGIRARKITIPGFYAEWAKTSFNLARMLIYVLTIVVIFPYLPGSGSPAFQGISIFLGVLLSLGSTSAVANVVAGVVLTYTRAFRSGDRIRIGDTEGVVVERSMFVTRLETTKNEVVSIPNSMTLSHHILNFSTQAKNRGLILHSNITLGYDVPWSLVHDLLISAAVNTEGIEKEPAPFVLQKSLDNYSIAYELNATTRDPHSIPLTYSMLHGEILDQFNQAGVEIMSPVFIASRDGSKIAIPKPDNI